MELSIGASENTYALNQGLSEMVWEELTPKLSDLFDQFAGEDEVLGLDKVELELGEIDLKSGNYDIIINQIIQELEAELQKHKFDNILRTGQESNRKVLSRQSIRVYNFELWLYWLENGILPSYVMRPENNWMPQVLETLALEHRAVSTLTKVLKKNPNALQRLILQHSVNNLKSLTEIYTGFSQYELLGFLEEIQQYLKKKKKTAPQLQIEYRVLEIKIWETIFEEAILKSQKLDSKSIFQQIILPVLPENLVKAMTTTSGNKLETHPHLFQSREAIKEESNKTAETIPDKKLTEKEQFPENSAITGMETPQFFKNAGLVLLGPFLHRFFQKLELLQEKKFKDHYCWSKAVLLLQFLVSGEEKIPEYEMLLPKFLCGMPANLAMDHTISLYREEKEEASSLLEAVIENWGALGGTSADGLREGFLIRDGKLIKTGSGWKLIVEPNAIDILLERLPWAIGMIKLPWMEELLTVEWR